ncbi:hypothetical protein PR202_gb27496 [Eleusine coracana subsp. coracana]|uniref:Uncharacterized protein n=1 Tax=Eleusine coracana subsp. coracana TaxID=191504 RepID=A0AAV5FUY1_ELECO|nr:hypothetical protein PR202_gb27496 [Eleusine coracana subsp. coracana]
MGVLTSTELNFLVFRYLQESGFIHAAFTLGYEAGIHKGGMDGNAVPPGALITIVQKGLQYIELEANTDETDEESEKDFALLEPLEIITKDVEELQQIVKKRKRERAQHEAEKVKGKDKERSDKDERRTGGERERDRHDKEKEPEREDRAEKDREQEKEKEKEKDKEKQQTERIDKAKPEEDSLAGGGPVPMDVSTTAHEITCNNVTVLEGHSSEVFACAWSPAGSLLASGSGDSTARIWTIPDGPCGTVMQSPPGVHVLKHFKGRTNEKSKDVTTLDWNSEVNAIKWDPTGSLLASCSDDWTAKVQESLGGRGSGIAWQHRRSGDTMERERRDGTSEGARGRRGGCGRARRSCDGGEMGGAAPLNRAVATSIWFVVGKYDLGRRFVEGKYNLGRQFVEGKYNLIWSMKQEKCVYDFKDHSKEIYTIRWSPTGPGTNNPNQQLLLASASFDSSIKLWEVEQGRLLYSLAGHRQPVYSVAFSPDGEYLASGSLDQCLHIWSVKEGRILKTFRGTGGIFEVCWNKEGSKIAACFSNNTVCVMDFRM